MSFTLDAEVYAKGEGKLDKVVEDYKLNIQNDPIVITGGEDGNDHVKTDTITRYRSVWRSLYRFCFLVGDYESALLLSDTKRPANPLPMKEETVRLYMQFMTKEEGSVLNNPTTLQPVTDVLGKPIKCIGRYTSPKSLAALQGAISKLHSHFESTKGVYQDGKCSDCHQLANDGKNEGCELHLYSPNVRRKGDTLNSIGFKNDLSKYKKYAKEHYTQKGNLQLTPGEVRQCRTYLLSHNDPVMFMIYVAMLLGIKLFLRIEEVLGMTVSQFVTNYFIITSNAEIQGLCTKVNGKTDDDWVHLMLWRDFDCPEFCVVSHILLWIELIGLKEDSVLFPHPEDIGKGTSSGVYTRPCDYNWFLEKMKHLVFDILKKDKEQVSASHIIGTHILRKTAYLFAIFGCLLYNLQKGKNQPDEIDKTTILLSARHRDLNCITKYVLDCTTVWAALKRMNSLDQHRVSAWESIHVQTHPTMQSIATECTRFQKPITELASDYVYNTLGIAKGVPRSVALFVDRAMRYVPDKTPHQELDSAITKLIPECSQQEFRRLVEKATQERLRAALTINPPPTPATPSVQQIEEGCIPPPPKRAKTLNDLEKWRQQMKESKSALEKLDTLIAIQKEVGKDLSKLTSGAKRWYRRLQPMFMCFKTCCGEDKNKFARVYAGKTLQITNFTCFQEAQHKFSTNDECLLP
jgi:hypothetical protein